MYEAAQYVSKLQQMIVEELHQSYSHRLFELHIGCLPVYLFWEYISSNDDQDRHQQCSITWDLINVLISGATDVAV